MCPWPKCEHIERSTEFIFPSKLNFCNLFQFPTTNIHSKINIFHTLALKFVKLDSIKSASPRANFYPTPRMFPNSNTVFSFNFIQFSLSKNGSIINSFRTITPTVSNQVSAPLLIERGLYEDTKSTEGWEISEMKQGACHIVALPFTL